MDKRRSRESSGKRGSRTASATILGVLLVALTLAAYWPVRHHEFIYYDDPQFVSENFQIQAGLTWGTVRYAFAHSLVGNWHPLTVLSHALDCQLFGINPGAHHLMNVVIHSINTLLLFWLLLNLTSSKWRSALVAAVFSLHPLRVESVAWVAERKDLLCGLFFFLSLLSYVRYVRLLPAGDPIKTANAPPHSAGQRRVFYVGAILAFAFGLMSKPMIVTLPFILLLLDYWPLGRVRAKNASSALKTLAQLTWEKAPFFVLASAGAVITFVVQKNAGATGVVGQSTLLERLGNAVSSYVRYLGKEVWPTDLAVIYPHPARHYYLSDQWPV